MKFGDKEIQLGIMYRREQPPEQLVSFVRSAEAAGYDEVWIVEDCFWGSGVAAVSTALAVTNKINVGLGIMPAVVRNPVFAAMEIATLAGIYPGRFLPGFGHGVAEWMEQIGAFPESQLAALGETVEAVKRLLKGEHFDFDGRHVHLKDVALEFPPKDVPPISLGVRGPKSLQMAGRVGDGTILAEFSAPEYVQWAREQIAQGQTEPKPHRLTVFAMAYFDADGEGAFNLAKARIGAAIAHGHIDPQLEAIGVLEQANALRRSNTLQSALPDAWVRDLVLAGAEEMVLDGVLRYIDAGADSLVLVPPTDQALAAPYEIAARLIGFLKE